MERLRAENAELQRQLDTCRRGFNNVVDMEMGTKQQLGDAERKVAELEAENAELRERIGGVESLCWDKLAEEGEHGDKHLEARIGLSLHGVMAAMDPDGAIFTRPYKIHPKVQALVAMRNERDLARANAENAKASEQEAWGKAEALKAENAELRAAAKYWNGLRRQLAWFEEREPEVHVLINACKLFGNSGTADDLVRWGRVGLRTVCGMLSGLGSGLLGWGWRG